MAEEALTQEQVNTIISNFDGEMVVIGHTILDNTIELLYEEKVISIDLEHEENFNNGFMNSLYYEDGNLYDFYTDGVNQTYTLLKTITNVDEPLQHSDILNVEICPNPTKSAATIKYTVPLLTGNGMDYPYVSLKIINAIGNQVQNLVNKTQVPGTYHIEFNGNELKSGIYYFRISVGNYNDFGKLVIID